MLPDEKVLPHLFHVVIEPDKLTAEIYTHDKQLHKAWSLSEGRQRVGMDDLHIDDTASDTSNDYMSSLNTLTAREQALLGQLRKQTKREQEIRFQVEQETRLQVEQEMRLQAEREIKHWIEREREEMRLQMERERGNMRLQRQQEKDSDDMAQEQSNVLLKPGKKRGQSK